MISLLKCTSSVVVKLSTHEHPMLATLVAPLNIGVSTPTDILPSQTKISRTQADWDEGLSHYNDASKLTAVRAAGNSSKKNLER